MRAQVDHRAARGEPAAVLRGEHGAAAGGEHDAFERGELGERLRLARAEAGLALDLEDQRHLHAAAALDLVVGVEEAQLQAPREQPPDGGLAGAHHADQVEVARALHRRHCRNKNGREDPAVVRGEANDQRASGSSGAR